MQEVGIENTVSYFAVYSEHKDKFHRLSYPSLPYRIVRTQEYEIRSAFFWPDWDPQSRVEVKNAKLEVLTDNENPFDHFTVGTMAPPVIESVGAGTNRSILKGTAVLSPNRSLSFSGKLEWSGNLAIDMRQILGELTPQKRREWLSQMLSRKAGDARVEKFELFGLGDPDTTLGLEFSAELPYFARRAGSRMIFEPSLYHHVSFDGEAPEVRTMPLFNRTRYLYIDSLTFTLPPGFASRGSNQENQIATRFGDYAVTISETPGSMIWESQFKQDSREIPLSDYADYYTFMSEVRDLSGKKIILQNGN